jgi:very-short-patch-repair endonuclease
MRSGRHHHSTDAADCACIRHWDEGPSASSFALPPVPRILLQIYRCRGAEAVFVALESARRLGLLTSGDLSWLRDRVDAGGTDLVDFSRDDADSGLESLVRLRTRGRGWTIRTQVRVVATGRVDLLIDDWLIIEADGKSNHDEPAHRHRDLMRDATAAAWGHVTLRFDYAMIVHDWDIVERAIEAIMTLRPARSGHRFGSRDRHPGERR